MCATFLKKVSSWSSEGREIESSFLRFVWHLYPRLSPFFNPPVNTQQKKVKSSSSTVLLQRNSVALLNSLPLALLIHNKHAVTTNTRKYTTSTYHLVPHYTDTHLYLRWENSPGASPGARFPGWKCDGTPGTTPKWLKFISNPLKFLWVTLSWIPLSHCLFPRLLQGIFGKVKFLNFFFVAPFLRDSTSAWEWGSSMSVWWRARRRKSMVSYPRIRRRFLGALCCLSRKIIHWGYCTWRRVTVSSCDLFVTRSLRRLLWTLGGRDELTLVQRSIGVEMKKKNIKEV